MRNTNIGRNEDDLEFGVIVGKRSVEEREENALLCRGNIELWHDKQLVISSILLRAQTKTPIIK